MGIGRDNKMDAQGELRLRGEHPQGIPIRYVPWAAALSREKMVAV